MGFAYQLVELAILAAIIASWAKWSRLDLGLRVPDFSAAWPWIALWVAWIGVEWAVDIFHPVEADPEWRAEMARLSVVEHLVVSVVLGPAAEELLFRGAMFAALLRRWGIWVAATFPSLLWGLSHIQYEGWYLASIAGSGIVLALARWKTGSVYLPIGLHAGFNLLDLLAAYLPFVPSGVSG